MPCDPLKDSSSQLGGCQLRSATTLAVTVKLQIRWDEPNPRHLPDGEGNRGDKAFEGLTLSQQPRREFVSDPLQIAQCCVRRKSQPFIGFGREPRDMLGS